MEDQNSPFDFEALKAYLSRPVADLGDMTARLRNTMKNEGMGIFANIYARKPEHFLRAPNTGHKTTNELKALLAQAGMPWEALTLKSPERFQYASVQKFQSLITADDITVAPEAVAMDSDSLMLLHFVSSDARQSLSSEFLASVVNDSALREKVRAVVADAVQSHLDRKGGPV